jgi:hypothetical protein
MRESIPEDWFGKRVRVFFIGTNAYGATDDAWAIHETEGTLKDANELGLLIDNNELITYRAVHHILTNPPKRR